MLSRIDVIEVRFSPLGYVVSKTSGDNNVSQLAYSYEDAIRRAMIHMRPEWAAHHGNC